MATQTPTVLETSPPTTGLGPLAVLLMHTSVTELTKTKVAPMPNIPPTMLSTLLVVACTALLTTTECLQQFPKTVGTTIFQSLTNTQGQVQLPAI